MTQDRNTAFCRLLLHMLLLGMPADEARYEAAITEYHLNDDEVQS